MSFEEKLVCWLVIFPLSLWVGFWAMGWAEKRLKSDQGGDISRLVKWWLAKGAMQIGFFLAFGLLMTFFQYW